MTFEENSPQERTQVTYIIFNPNIGIFFMVPIIYEAKYYKCWQ